MSSVLAAFANGAIVSAMLTAAVWLALRLAPRKRLNAATRYAFWWATLAATLALPVVYLRLPRNERVAEALPTIRTAAAVGLSDSGNPPVTQGPRTGRTVHAGKERPVGTVLSVPSVAWILAAWLAVSLLLLGRLVVAWVLLDRRRARATACTRAENWLALYRGIRTGIRLASSSEIAIPIAVGLRHPAILIPARLLEELNDEDLGQIVVHEAAHLARRDDYALLVERVIEALFAFHPVVRWITRQIDLEREVACDDFVVEATGQARSYASCLTRMVELCGGVHASLAGATAASDRSHLAKRIDRLLDKTRHTGTRLLRARLAAMVALLVAAAWMVGRMPGLVAFAMPQPAAARAVAPVAAAAVPMSVTTAATASVVDAGETPVPPAAVAEPAPPAPPSPQAAEIKIPVEVTDPMGRFVTGLTRDNFKLFEDGVEQQILQFSNKDLPISVGILVDVSGSMSLKMKSAQAAVSQFLQTARPDDEFFLLEFNHVPVVTVPFIHDPEAIQNSLSNAQTRGGTAMRDALYLAINEMKQARNRRRAILIVSDGADNSSSHSASEMADTLREADLQVYAINLADRPERRAFAGIVEAGGVDSVIYDLASAPDGAARIAAGLRNSYVISYTSSNTVRDGKYRRVQVQIVQTRGFPPLTVRFRSGYYAQ